MASGSGGGGKGSRRIGAQSRRNALQGQSGNYGRNGRSVRRQVRRMQERRNMNNIPF